VTGPGQLCLATLSSKGDVAAYLFVGGTGGGGCGGG